MIMSSLQRLPLNIYEHEYILLSHPHITLISYIFLFKTWNVCQEFPHHWSPNVKNIYQLDKSMSWQISHSWLVFMIELTPNLKCKHKLEASALLISYKSSGMPCRSESMRSVVGVFSISSFFSTLIHC